MSNEKTQVYKELFRTSGHWGAKILSIPGGLLLFFIIQIICIFMGKDIVVGTISYKKINKP